jgi:BolA protein
MSRIETMKARLATLTPTTLEIIDDSQQHARHGPAKAGAGYYTVHIVATAFTGKNTLARQRMVYSALGDMMDRDIHALNIKAKTPEE